MHGLGIKSDAVLMAQAIGRMNTSVQGPNILLLAIGTLNIDRPSNCQMLLAQPDFDPQHPLNP